MFIQSLKCHRKDLMQEDTVLNELGVEGHLTRILL